MVLSLNHYLVIIKGNDVFITNEISFRT